MDIVPAVCANYYSRDLLNVPDTDADGVVDGDGEKLGVLDGPFNVLKEDVSADHPTDAVAGEVWALVDLFLILGLRRSQRGWL